MILNIIHNIFNFYISQLIRYFRACSLYSFFFLQHLCILITKLLNQGFLKNRLILSFKMFFGRYQHLVGKYSVSYVHMTKDGIGNSNMTAYISSTSICRYISTFSTCALKLSIGNKKKHNLKSFCNE